MNDSSDTHGNSRTVLGCKPFWTGWGKTGYRFKGVRWAAAAAALWVLLRLYVGASTYTTCTGVLLLCVMCVGRFDMCHSSHAHKYLKFNIFK